MKATILIVEDNPVNMELVSDLLEPHGFTLLRASDAEHGILLASAELPDLILMDVGLPGMDGLEAARLLSGDARTRHIPVVALTAHAMAGDAERAVDAGCAGYLSKPIQIKTFLSSVAQFIEARRANRNAA
ncbi:MAG TPA: response regulator [Chthonomonadaceae bacterium]|nr:response regulator [Chthonomonadaceae bacterium]